MSMVSVKELKTAEPKKYMAASMPTRGTYYSDRRLFRYCTDKNGGASGEPYSNSNEHLLISQPLPDTVTIVHEKPNLGKKDSYWLGCLIACFLCCAVKNERAL